MVTDIAVGDRSSSSSHRCGMLCGMGQNMLCSCLKKCNEGFVALNIGTHNVFNGVLKQLVLEE